MRWLLMTACLLDVCLAAPLAAESRFPTQFSKISEADARLVLEKVRQAQAALRSGKQSLYGLKSGSAASYEMARVSPRDAFLALDFTKPWSVERLSPANANRHRHLVTILPEGPGPDKFVWKIEVLLGYSGEIADIEMMYQPVAPF